MLNLLKRTNCIQQYVSKILKGKENLTLEMVANIEQSLNIRLTNLWFAKRFRNCVPLRGGDSVVCNIVGFDGGSASSCIVVVRWRFRLLTSAEWCGVLRG